MRFGDAPELRYYVAVVRDSFASYLQTNPFRFCQKLSCDKLLQVGLAFVVIVEYWGVL